MSVRVRLGGGFTYGRTGLRWSGRVVGPLRASTGRSGTFLRAALGPLLWSRRVR